MKRKTFALVGALILLFFVGCMCVLATSLISESNTISFVFGAGIFAFSFVSACVIVAYVINLFIEDWNV